MTIVLDPAALPWQVYALAGPAAWYLLMAVIVRGVPRRVLYNLADCGPAHWACLTRAGRDAEIEATRRKLWVFSPLAVPVFAVGLAAGALGWALSLGLLSPPWRWFPGES